jgi:predicted transcriptional regulator
VYPAFGVSPSSVLTRSSVAPAAAVSRTIRLVRLYGSYGMVSSMKTTVNLPDELLREAQELARRERTTLRELIETGLRTVVKQRSGTTRFVLEDASVDGAGLQPAFRGASWEQIRDEIYRQSA